MALTIRMPRLLGRGGLGLPTLYQLLGGAADFQVAVAFQLARLVPGQAGVSNTGVTVLVASSDQVLARLVATLGLGPD